ncbi:TIGR00282 family metallophosphoesterase [Effusibacillus dendaii]|uniref:TIGR00282 family metallophosphoesterase n=1 Tax=Effusibacillus dendaii TaxID=2743772 RepID=UPI00190B78A9|nr:TIGR00282 family metallophosphoesterase [Effusibacillus dendaii]
MRILFIGDIVGQPGRTAVTQYLPQVLEEYNPDLTIANAENAANGRGLTPKLAEMLFDANVDILTMGNHVWDNKDIFGYIEDEKRIVRPANFPKGAPGQGFTLVRAGNVQIAVVNLLGRVFMGDYDSPFVAIDQILEEIGDASRHIFVDFHAEATSEKLAFAHYVDGRVSAVIGTHTHVQTADEQILLHGTAYLTDVGMCGPVNSIIGMKTEQVIQRFLTQMPIRFEVENGPAMLNAVCIDLSDTGKAVSIERIHLK